jgi:hypothetical protein
MDILVALVICLMTKIVLWYCRKPKHKKRKRKREPWLALLFGNGYYWVKVNRVTDNHQ